MKTYTKEFDLGHTRLFTGERVRKDDPRLEAVGTLDELSTILGFAWTFSNDKQIKDLLSRFQRDIFRICSDLASPKEGSLLRRPDRVPRLLERHVEDMERLMVAFEQELPPLSRFIFAAGTPDGASLHLARTVCRKAERRLVTAHEKRPINTEILRYVNRLSDFLFYLARIANARAGAQESVWDYHEDDLPEEKP